MWLRVDFYLNIGIFSWQVHRLVVVDNDDRVIGVISLSDILTELVLKPSRKS